MRNNCDSTENFGINAALEGKICASFAGHSIVRSEKLEAAKIAVLIKVQLKNLPLL